MNIMLTDKARIDFNKWLSSKRNETIIDGDIEYDLVYLFNYILPEDLKKNLIIEWFDMVNIYINPTQRMPQEVNKWAFIVDFELYDKLLFKTRQEASEEAIKKANQIYNAQSKA